MKIKYMPVVHLFFVTLFFTQAVKIKAQGKDAIVVFLKQIQQVYNNAGYVSFDIRYTYARESTPRNIADSVAGTIRLYGNKYDVLLDSIETIKNNSHTISIFYYDKAIYVNNNAAHQEAGINPLSVIDSAVAKMSIAKSRITQSGKYTTCSMLFPPGSAYKKIELTADTATGFLFKVEYLVRRELLGDVLQDNGDKIPEDGYSLITANYYNYSSNQFDVRVFEDANYFTLNGALAQPTEKYKAYQLYMATPNL